MTGAHVSENNQRSVGAILEALREAIKEILLRLTATAEVSSGGAGSS